MRDVSSKIRYGVEPETETTVSWLLTFNDFITLLLVFFIFIFLTGSINTVKTDKMVVSLQDALGVLKEGKKVEVFLIKTSQEIALQPQESSGSSDVNYLKSTELIDDIAKNPEISVIQSPKGLYISLSDSILFQTGASELRSEGYPFLDKIIQVINSNGFNIRVEGHSDNTPVRGGRFASNWELSIARAVHVVKYFIDVGKVSPERLSAVGYGESKPLFPNDSPANKGRNRRVEIILEMMGS